MKADSHNYLMKNAMLKTPRPDDMCSMYNMPGWGWQQGPDPSQPELAMIIQLCTHDVVGESQPCRWQLCHIVHHTGCIIYSLEEGYHLTWSSVFRNDLPWTGLHIDKCQLLYLESESKGLGMVLKAKLWISGGTEEVQRLSFSGLSANIYTLLNYSHPTSLIQQLLQI